MKKFPAWSFSSLQTFEQCPTKWKAKYVTKTYKEPPQAHLEHGVRVHKALEDRLKDGTTLPEDCRNYEGYILAFNKFPSKQVLTEYQIGLTEGLQPTGFFAPDVWYRGVVDVGLVGDNSAVIVDWKTGKRKPDFTQLNLFSAAMFVAFPEVQSIKQTFVWLKTHQTDSETMTRDGVEVFWRKMLPRIERMKYAYENDHYFEKPSGLCGYCWHHECQFCKTKG